MQALFAEWIRTDRNFNQRMADLVAVSRTSLNGSDLLTPFTVTAGGNSDSLVDGPGLNWNLITVGQDSVMIAEGQSLTLSPTAVAPSSGTLSYAWNLNGNGNYNQASGSDPTLTWSQLNALGINDGPETFQMRLRITNGHEHNEQPVDALHHSGQSDRDAQQQRDRRPGFSCHRFLQQSVRSVACRDGGRLRLQL